MTTLSSWGYTMYMIKNKRITDKMIESATPEMLLKIIVRLEDMGFCEYEKCVHSVSVRWEQLEKRWERVHALLGHETGFGEAYETFRKACG